MTEEELLYLCGYKVELNNAKGGETAAKQPLKSAASEPPHCGGQISGERAAMSKGIKNGAESTTPARPVRGGKPPRGASGGLS